MNHIRPASWFLVATSLFFCSCSKREEMKIQAVKMNPLEGYPQSVIQALDRRQKSLSVPPARFTHIQAVISVAKKWDPGHTITVAFQGGSPTLRQQIIGAVKSWSDAANVVFDFGPNSSAGVFREWSTADTSYVADIRIGFVSGGYWSEIAKDSIDPSIAKPGEESMNFEGFTDNLSLDQQATVLHEFGHALGFEHEHQNPQEPCDTDFRWNDDPGYVPTPDTFGQLVPDASRRRPGIYTVLEGPLNNWSKDQIDFNLRRLPNTSDYRLSAFDVKSIMKYYFDDWMFVNGIHDRCYSAANNVLSAEDKQAVLDTYPRSGPLMQAAISKQRNAINEMLSLKNLPQDMATEYRANLKSLTRSVSK
jgi:hypothetical protein